MTSELVSIITPMYNAARFVGQTIESVLAQTCPRWEMLIVDDGSRDSSYDIAVAYAKKDPRIKVFRQPNGGCSAARNNGLRRATGKYICLLDADDLWEPCFLEEQIRFMKEKNAGLVCSSHKRIDENGEECLKPLVVPEEITYAALLRTNSASCLTVMYDREKVGLHFFREDFKNREDLICWLEIIKITKIIYGNQKILARYRVMTGSNTGNKMKVVKPQFMVYRKVEKLGLFRSLYYTVTWAVNGYLKYRK
jgi:glycosyltransferase involved in cell wall biosynthesis